MDGYWIDKWMEFLIVFHHIWFCHYKSAYNLFICILKSPTAPTFPPNKLVGPQYRPTFTDQEIARRKKHQRKKEERAKAKEEARMFSNWIIDNELSKERELTFK